MPKLSLEEVDDYLEDREPQRQWREKKKKVLDANAEKKEIKKSDVLKKVEE